MILGIDLGTQGLKALVVGEDFEVLGSGFCACPVHFPRPGWAEQDPGDWEVALGQAVGQAVSEAKGARVEAVGITGQLDGCLAVDADARPLGPCLIWMDRRSELPPDPGLRELLLRESGINPDPGHMAAKIGWLRANRPETRVAACFHQPVSYLLRRLTGVSMYDHGLASTTMLYSLARRDYDPRLLEAFGIRAEQLPRIGEAEEVGGYLTAEGARLTGLQAGIPVAVGTGDDFASPLGAGVAEPGAVVCVAGTAEVVGALSDEPVVDPTGFVETHSYPGGLHFIENPGWLSGGALLWFVRTFRLTDYRELDALAAGAAPGCDGVSFLPALTGSMAPEWHASARGCFYGLTAAHGAGHLARAVLEGCAFAMRDVVQRLRALEVRAERIVLTGGGSTSALWAEIRADVSGLEVQRTHSPGTAPLGAAMLAAVAAEFVPGLRECAGRVRRAGERVAPNCGRREIYDRAYTAYRRLFSCLKPIFAEE